LTKNNNIKIQITYLSWIHYRWHCFGEVSYNSNVNILATDGQREYHYQRITCKFFNYFNRY